MNAGDVRVKFLRKVLQPFSGSFHLQESLRIKPMPQDVELSIYIPRGHPAIFA